MVRWLNSIKLRLSIKYDWKTSNYETTGAISREHIEEYELFQSRNILFYMFEAIAAEIAE